MLFWISTLPSSGFHYVSLMSTMQGVPALYTVLGRYITCSKMFQDDHRGRVQQHSAANVWQPFLRGTCLRCKLQPKTNAQMFFRGKPHVSLLRFSRWLNWISVGTSSPRTFSAASEKPWQSAKWPPDCRVDVVGCGRSMMIYVLYIIESHFNHITSVYIHIYEINPWDILYVYIHCI